MYIVLVGVLASALWRHVHHCSLEQLEQALLHALAAHVARDAWVVGLARNLVNLVDEDDAALRRLHVVVGHLQQARENALHVLAHVSRLGEHRCVYDGERHLQQFCYGACEQRLARTGRADHDDVALLYLHAVVLCTFRVLLQTLVVVVYGYRQILLRIVLTDDILVEIFLYLRWFRHVVERHVECARVLARSLRSEARFEHNLISLLRTRVADEAVQSGDEEIYVLLASSAEATYFLWHFCSSLLFTSCVSLLGRSFRTP